MEAKASLVGGLDTLAARLDGLSVDQDPEDLSRTFRSAFTEGALYKMYLSFLVADKTRAKALLEVFDKAIAAPQHDVKLFKKFRQLCGRTGLLPDSHIIPNKFIQTTEDPVASGGFGDVWEGIYNGERVAIKALRIYKDDDVQKVRKVFCKEVAIWKHISHPNIVPFLGVSEAPAPLSMVSQWMSNGNVREYVLKNPEVSRLQLLLDIGRGLSFLHSLDIIHGDLKGDNILVDKLGCARLNDFGFTAIASLNCTETSAPGFQGSYRWMAPELLGGIDDNLDKSGTPTPQSDVFAFGMVAVEVFSGHMPFSESERSYVVIRKIAGGERPPRPPKSTRLGLSDELWAVIQASWRHELAERSALSTFVDLLERANPDIATLEELTGFDENSDDHLAKLHTIFGYSNNTLFGMREKETLVLVEVFDRVLNSSLDDGTIRSRCLRGLQKVSARCGILPKSYRIAYSSLAPFRGAFSSTGRVSDICQRSMDGQLVAVKMISPDRIEDFNAFKKKLCSNAVMWKRFKHPNLVNFLGFCSDSPPFSLVYPWMSKGNLSEYLRKHPEVDKLGLLLDVAEGLAYLHQYNVVHGNLTGHNILVDGNGTACVSEYGLELVLREEASTKLLPTNLRWMAPEVVTTDKKNKPVDVDDGKRADVYSFAMVMFEILTGSAPFPSANDEEIVAGIKMGYRPDCPSNNPSQGLVDALWEQMEACWHDDPGQRPAVLTVLQSLRRLSKEMSQERPKEPIEPQESQELQDSQKPQESLEHPEELAWDYVEDTSELPSPGPKGHRERFSDHLSLSGSTLVNSSLGRLFSGTKRDPSKSRRQRVKKHVRHLLHLSKSEVVATEPVRKPESEIEIVDQREENVDISDGSVSYLSSKPIPNGKKLKKVVITVDAKDQGWSSYPEDHGTYRNSWTWFELSIGRPSGGGPVERWRGEVVKNLHAHGEFKEHTIEILDKGLYEKAESGDVMTVWAHARFPGWRNTVKKATIRYVVE